MARGHAWGPGDSTALFSQINIAKIHANNGMFNGGYRFLFPGSQKGRCGIFEQEQDADDRAERGHRRRRVNEGSSDRGAFCKACFYF